MNKLYTCFLRFNGLGGFRLGVVYGNFGLVLVLDPRLSLEVSWLVAELRPTPRRRDRRA